MKYSNIIFIYIIYLTTFIMDIYFYYILKLKILLNCTINLKLFN